MTKQFFFTDGGSDITDNGTFEIDMPSNYGECLFSIAAYDSSNNAVTPSVGSATFSASPIPGQYHEVSSVGLSTAGEDATYDMPSFIGPASKARLVISGADVVTDGIAYFKAVAWRN